MNPFLGLLITATMPFVALGLLWSWQTSLILFSIIAIITWRASKTNRGNSTGIYDSRLTDEDRRKGWEVVLKHVENYNIVLVTQLITLMTVAVSPLVSPCIGMNCKTIVR